MRNSSSKNPLHIGFVSTRFSGTDGVSLETEKWADVLENMGHKLKQSSYSYGNMQAIVIDQGKIEAASDPRGIGLSIVVDD